MERMLKELTVELDNTSSKLMIYGCYGYTGELIVELIVEKCSDLIRNERIILAGRSGEKVKKLVEKVLPQHMASRVSTVSFSIDANRVDDIERVLRRSNTKVLLNCAGPFVQTAKPMIQGCLRAGVSYLDITGEWKVFEYALDGKALNKEAVAKKDIVVMPGVGYDVVPSDCCIAKLSEAFREKFDGETPHSIDLAMTGDSGISHGTAKTVVHSMADGMHTRRDGKIVPVPLFHTVKNFDMPNRKSQQYASVSWGDIATGYYSSGNVPNIDIYFPAPVPKIVTVIFQMYLVQWLIHALFNFPFVVPFLCKMIEIFAARGPALDARQKGKHTMVGYAYNRDHSHSVAARCTVSNGYKLTSETALITALRILVGKTNKYGCLTPSQAFGSNYINEFEGCKLEVLNDE